MTGLKTCSGQCANTLCLVLRRFWTSGVLTAVALAVALTTGCDRRPGDADPDEIPILGIPSVTLEQRVLRQIEGLPPNEARTAVDLSIKMLNVRDRDWKIMTFLPILAAGSGEIVAVVKSAPRGLPKGESTFAETLEISAEGLPLGPGSYVLQPLFLVGRDGDFVTDFEQVPLLFSGNRRPQAAFVSAPDENLDVLDQGEEAIRSYQAAIDSGNPNTVLKGLSALVGHYRERRQYDLAEQAVRRLVTATAGDQALAKMHPVFRFWNVDDRRLAGDIAGAVALLETLIDETPDNATFLGEPFKARALLEMARLHFADDNLPQALAAYNQLLNSFPGMHRSTTLMERANIHLRLGDFAAARQNYEEITETFALCNIVVESAPTPSDDVAEARVCPTAEQAASAERRLQVLDSDRAWFREAPDAIVTAIQQALDSRVIADLDAVAAKIGFRYVAGAGEWQEGNWEVLMRPFMQRVLEDSPDARLRVGPRGTFSQTLVLEDLDPSAGAGPTGSVFLTLDSTPFGWQWGAMNAVPLRFPRIDDDFDPCPIDIEAGETECGGGSGGGSTPPGGGTQDDGSRLPIQAPWSPGVHMRAGGLQSAIDFVGLSAGAIADLLLTVVPGLSGKCGAGVPGYLYGIDTHTGGDHFAVDYTQGQVLFCVLGVCLTPPAAVARELAQIAKDNLFGGATTTPAFSDPVLAAHEGVVLNSNFSYLDGDNDPDNVNRVDIGVWKGNPPGNLAEIIADLVPALNPNDSRDLAEVLDSSDVDFWLKHLHLRRSCDGRCPSRGMWVSAGEKIGLIDDTGKSFTSHLHFVVRQRPDSGANVKSNWRSVVQVIDGDFLGENDNGKCIKSKNELVLTDRDGDLIVDTQDNCILEANPQQEDFDRDGIGDTCDGDRDNDGVPNDLDKCPDGSDVDDFDGDGIFDGCDPDRDNDGVANAEDICPFFDDALDRDFDGIPNGCDPDADGDNFDDARCDRELVLVCGCIKDLFPDDPQRAGDHDSNGVDSLNEACPCRNVNPQCTPFDDLGPKGPPLGIVTIGGFGRPFGPDVPGNDPFGPGGGNPFGPGGSIP